MSRFQLSINVDDVDAAVDFYTRLFGVEPAKHRPGYANFVVDDPSMKLIVIEKEGAPGTINHLGIEHADGAAVAAETARVGDAGLPVQVDEEHTCCFATQQKAWTVDPDGTPWELYTVVEDASEFGANPHGGAALDALLPSVSRQDVRQALADGTVVIDAQGSGGFEAAHIDGAINFELDNVVGQAERHIGALDDPVVVYCTDTECLGAEFVGTQLVNAGYTNVTRFAGGVAEWMNTDTSTPAPA